MSGLARRGGRQYGRGGGIPGGRRTDPLHPRARWKPGGGSQRATATGTQSLAPGAGSNRLTRRLAAAVGTKTCKDARVGPSGLTASEGRASSPMRFEPDMARCARWPRGGGERGADGPPRPRAVSRSWRGRVRLPDGAGSKTTDALAPPCGLTQTWQIECTRRLGEAGNKGRTPSPAIVRFEPQVATVRSPALMGWQRGTETLPCPCSLDQRWQGRCDCRLGRAWQRCTSAVARPCGLRQKWRGCDRLPSRAGRARARSFARAV